MSNTTTTKRRSSRNGTKQSRVIALLSRSNGTTIPAIIKATGWQSHSVRGFFAGIVRKRLGLKLESKKADGKRVYHIPARKSSSKQRTT